MDSSSGGILNLMEINPIPAGVLENHVWWPNMKNKTSLEGSYALLSKSAKKLKNLKNCNFLQNPFIENIWAKRMSKKL